MLLCWCKQKWKKNEKFCRFQLSFRSSCSQMFLKMLGLQLYEKETLTQVFSCEIWEIFNDCFFYSIPLVAASVPSYREIENESKKSK